MLRHAVQQLSCKASIIMCGQVCLFLYPGKLQDERLVTFITSFDVTVSV